MCGFAWRLRRKPIESVYVKFKGQAVAAQTFDTFVGPAFSAYRHVSVVASDFNLCTLCDDLAFAVDTGVDDSLSAA